MSTVLTATIVVDDKSAEEASQFLRDQLQIAAQDFQGEIDTISVSVRKLGEDRGEIFARNNGAQLFQDLDAVRAESSSVVNPGPHPTRR